MDNNRCMGCMENTGGAQICPYCGYDRDTLPALPTFLCPGSMLRGRYLVGRALGHGGFGVTYIGWDTVLGIKLAMKEYFPKDCAVRAAGTVQVTPYSGEPGERFAEGLDSFLTEARTLARFEGHSGIVGVRDFFTENGTAYLVMRYLEGTTLREYLKKRGGRLSWEEAVSIMAPAMEALTAVHEAGVLHRDVSPDNIFVTKQGEVKILDFGAARQALGQSISLSVILKPGYAPEEQYRSHGQQGPWSDVYAAAATLYRCVTGKVPPESLDRLAEDTLRPPSEMGVVMPASAERALMRGMALRARDRYASMDEFLVDLLTEAQSSTVALPPQPRAEQRVPPRSAPNAAPQKAQRAQPVTSPQWQPPRERSAPAYAHQEPDVRKYERKGQPRNGETGGYTASRPGVPKRRDAARAVVLVVLVFAIVGGGIYGVSAVIDRYSGGFNFGLGGVKNPPTASPTQGAVVTGSAQPTPPGDATPEPDGTPDPNSSPEPGGNPETTPEPTPEVAPPPPVFAGSVTQGSGTRSSQGASAYQPRAGQQLVRYSDGDHVVRVVAQLQSGVSTAYVALSDESGSISGGGYVEHYIVRGDGLFTIPDANLSTIEMVLPDALRIGTKWTQGGATCEVIAVNEFLRLGGVDYKDVLVVNLTGAQGTQACAYVPGIGLHTVWEGQMWGQVLQQVVSVNGLTPEAAVMLQTLSQNQQFAR